MWLLFFFNGRAPYCAIDEQKTILFAPLDIAAEKIATDAETIFCVMMCGENTDKPSYAVAAQ